VHVHAIVDGALDLNRLSAVALLGVQLSTVSHIGDRLDEHHVVVLLPVVRVVVSAVRVGRRNDGLALRIEAKVGLVHQLLVERRVDHGVVLALCILVVTVVGGGSTSHFVSIFEELI